VSNSCELILGLTICYLGTYITSMKNAKPIIERVQTGVRIEKRLLKVLKGLAEHLDMSVGDLIEGIALHSFESKAPFSAETLAKIAQLKTVYDLDWTAADSHTSKEAEE